MAAVVVQPGISATEEDKNPFCADWAASGECARNPGYMMLQCPRSCVAPTERVQIESVQESIEFPDSSLHESSEAAGSKQEGMTTPEDAMARLADQLRPPQQQSSRKPAAVEIPAVTADAHAEATETIAPKLNRGISPEALAAPGDDVGMLLAKLQRCKTESERSITEARRASFEELRNSHEQDVKDALFLREREFKQELEQVKREARRTEMLLNAALREAERRKEEAEKKLQHITSGEEHLQAVARANGLAKALGDEELVRLRLEEQFRETMSKSQVREHELAEALQAATTRAEMGDSKVARLTRQLWLRRKLLVRRTHSNASESDSNSSADEAEWEMQCLVEGSVPVGAGICRKGKAPEVAVIQTELPASTLKRSVLEAMQILSPMQDSAIWHMHADLCLAQAQTRTDLCTVSLLYNTTSWLAAFAWVALWRCVWVLSIRYFISCCGSLAAHSVRLWDRFSSWFFGFRGKDQLMVQEM
jgi:hypothetical protein